MSSLDEKQVGRLYQLLEKERGPGKYKEDFQIASTETD